MSASTRTTYSHSGGVVAVDSLTKQILVTMNRLLALPKWGGEEENATVTQGSYRPWTSYSGPTHRGCGAVDLTNWNWQNRFYWLDLLGMPPFHRTSAQGPWNPHIHALTDGLGCVDPYAKGQITEAKNGGDGLKGSKPDPDKTRRSGLWPLAVYQGRTGWVTANQKTNLRTGPSYDRSVTTPAPRGTRVNAIMEVNVDGDRWFVTDKGEFGFSGKWAK